jgi:hypothetical protein
VTSFDPARVRRLAVLLLGCVAMTALGLAVAPSASAHPFGDPQTIEVSTEDGDVRLRWKVGGTDDLTALALHLDLLPADRVLLDGAVLFEDGDGERLASSPDFTDYLLDRVHVTSGGAACPGEVLPVGDLAADGAVLSFACGADPDEVEVEARMLTDLHPDYRTLASGPRGQRTVYDEDHPEHTWSLSGASAAAGSPAHSAAVQLGSVLGVAAAGGVGAAFYVRRRGRREGALAA